jgi:thiamine-monophosphate kinase
VLLQLDPKDPTPRQAPGPGESAADPRLFDPEGLERRRRRLDAFLQSEPWARSLVEAYIAPSARIAAGRALARAVQPFRGGESGAAGRHESERPVSALIDVSDGLYGDLLHICEESRVRARLDAGRLPTSPDLEQAARHFGLARSAWSLRPSDDYELLLTVRPEAAADMAVRIRAECALPVAEIGEIVEAVGSAEESGVETTGLPEGSRASGWDHFGGGRKA